MPVNKLVLSTAAVLFFLCSCSENIQYVRTVEQPVSKYIILPAKPKSRPYKVNGETYYPLTDSEGFIQTGKASWYGQEFHGRPTASGEIFDMYKKSAAHKTLPLGTYVSIQNLSNSKTTVVMINDRGPFIKGRHIDLSYAAAKEIDLVGPGVIDVKIVALGKEVGKLESPEGIKSVIKVSDLRSGEFTVQVGAFKDKNNALRLADRLKVIFDYVEIELYDDKTIGTIYRLRVSKSPTLAKAMEIEKRLKDMGFEEAFTVSL
ncbi:MAG: septal ring lytic transglycosylase RlpA family protein [Deltaproteobacteria bacterium]|nr:septal ring lytic transglycosylase RlpA family protein [Deltaproteobacteria bacterium]